MDTAVKAGPGQNQELHIGFHKWMTRSWMVSAASGSYLESIWDVGITFVDFTCCPTAQASTVILPKLLLASPPLLTTDHQHSVFRLNVACLFLFSFQTRTTCSICFVCLTCFIQQDVLQFHPFCCK